MGLAQNFAALRALAIEGINKGHMVLHSRSIAQKAGVPKHLIEDACKYMAYKKKYDQQTVNEFMEFYMKPKLWFFNDCVYITDHILNIQSLVS